MYVKLSELEEGRLYHVIDKRRDELVMKGVFSYINTMGMAVFINENNVEWPASDKHSLFKLDDVDRQVEESIERSTDRACDRYEYDKIWEKTHFWQGSLRGHINYLFEKIGLYRSNLAHTRKMARFFERLCIKHGLLEGKTNEELPEIPVTTLTSIHDLEIDERYIVKNIYTSEAFVGVYRTPYEGGGLLIYDEESKKHRYIFNTPEFSFYHITSPK